MFTIVMENHSASAILGNAQAPYINQLAKANAVATAASTALPPFFRISKPASEPGADTDTTMPCVALTALSPAASLDTEETMRAFDSEWKRPSDGHLTGGAFHCESPQEVDRLYAELVEAGATRYKEPWDAFWGMRYAQLRDPDGTVIDLYAPLPE